MLGWLAMKPRERFARRIVIAAIRQITAMNENVARRNRHLLVLLMRVGDEN